MTVAVTVNDEPLLQSEALTGFKAWQLHGNESPESCARLSIMKTVIKVVPGGEMDAEKVTEYESSGVSAFLLDTPSSQHGGTGRTFNWDEALRFGNRTRLPLILSGGLSTQNLENALEMVHPMGVDVCSGVEFAPGRKDTLRMHQFIKLCKKC
jgi:phosphoribosylanthranilate isomerase